VKKIIVVEFKGSLPVGNLIHRTLTPLKYVTSESALAMENGFTIERQAFATKMRESAFQKTAYRLLPALIARLLFAYHTQK
jgi:hypothetical protein